MAAEDAELQGLQEAPPELTWQHFSPGFGNLILHLPTATPLPNLKSESTEGAGRKLLQTEELGELNQLVALRKLTEITVRQVSLYYGRIIYNI